MKGFKIQNNVPVPERLATIERMINRLMLGLSNKAKAVLTPYPISSATIGTEVKGIVLTYMFPCAGKITKGAIDLGKKPKQSVTVSLSLVGESSGVTNSFILDKQRFVVSPDIDVKEFDKLTISLSYESEKIEDALTNVWVSFLWIPTTKDIEVKSFMLEELENDLIEYQDKTLTE